MGVERIISQKCKKICSGENRHEQSVRTKNHENRKCIRWNPASGPLRGTAGRVWFLNCLFLIRRGGDPSGAAAIIVNGRVFKKISYHC